MCWRRCRFDPFPECAPFLGLASTTTRRAAPLLGSEPRFVAHSSIGTVAHFEAGANSQ